MRAVKAVSVLQLAAALVRLFGLGPAELNVLSAQNGELCRFANGETPKVFIHPVVRAIAVHFWLAYDHPFCDGNGRTARALFYWVMLHQGY